MVSTGETRKQNLEKIGRLESTMVRQEELARDKQGTQVEMQRGSWGRWATPRGGDKHKER
jgi:hypothetical protein